MVVTKSCIHINFIALLVIKFLPGIDGLVLALDKLYQKKKLIILDIFEIDGIRSIA